MKGVRLSAALVAAALLLAACGGDDDDGDRSGAGPAPGPESFDQPFTDVEAYPVFVSSEIVAGENRFLVGLLNSDDAPIGSEDIEVSLDFYDLGGSAERPVFSTDTDFVPIDEFRGLYQASVTFENAGKWGAEVAIFGGGYDETVRASFQVLRDSTTPGIGERVPASDTPTIGDAKKLSDISTDRDPDPRFYRVSIAEALRAGEPFVVAFATPKFCQTATCGPMLDQVQEIARDFPRTTFIHVEPYDLDKVPDLQPIKASLEWGLPSEPWTFVVDERGRLVAKYEGVLDSEGLRETLRVL